MCSVSVTSLIYSSGNQRTWTSPGPLVLARAKGMRGCGENTVSCSCRPLALTFKQRLFLYLGDSKKQKSKKKKKEKEKKNYRGIITKISAAPPKTNQSWFRVWTKYLQPEFPNCPSCRLVLWFTGGWQGAGRRATRFPDCSIVKSFFSLPTWKALNNVYKMLGNPGRFPI